MTLSVRLDTQLEKQVDVLVRLQGISKSELVRRCLQEYIDHETNRPTAWELGKHLFGRYGSGRSDLSKKVEKIVSQKVRAKHNRQRQ